MILEFLNLCRSPEPKKMPPTLAQNRGYLIRDIKKSIQHINLSIAKINPDKEDLKKQILKIESLYYSFTKLDEEYVEFVNFEETALKTADAQSEEIYAMFLEASNRVKAAIEKPADKTEDAYTCQTARFHQRIAPKPIVFTGNSDDFLTWSAEFKDATMHLFVSEKFQLLKQYTGGRAREAILPFLLGEHSEKTFHDAFSCLKKRFGDNDLTADHYLQRLENWHRINSGESLQEFVDFLRIVLALSSKLLALDIVNSKLFNKKNLWQNCPKVCKMIGLNILSMVKVLSLVSQLSQLSLSFLKKRLWLQTIHTDSPLPLIK